LATNPDYWGSKPYLEKMEFRFFGDLEDLRTSYERKEIHGFRANGSRDLSFLARWQDVQLFFAQSAGYGMIYLNLQRESKPFLQEREVRQALLYALDRRLLIDQELGGYGLVADSPVLPMTWAYDPSVRRYGYDPERAIGLLDASGWLDSDGDRVRDKDGVELALSLLTNEDPAMVRMAEDIARQWGAVGIDATVRAVTSASVTHFVQHRNFDAAFIELSLVADPDPYPLWHSTRAGEFGQNYSGFANEEADLLMEEGRSTADLERRTELYRAFQRIFVEELPALPIYYPIYTYAVDAQVRGVQLSSILHTSNRFRNVDEWYVQTEEIPVTQ
jgi:peptide/nickel transport system substrate-binding protein